jgi:protein TonB
MFTEKFIEMRSLLFSTSLLFVFSSLCAQSDSSSIKSSSEESKIFTFVEQMPQFPGGDAALVKFLQKKIKYPKEELSKDIQGKVLIKFVVNEDGKVSDVTVERGASPGLDKEAVRVVKSMPKFKPGKQQGKAVKVYFMLPIIFKLQ